MIEQRTDEWLKQRAGCITASRIVDVMAEGRSGKPSVTRLGYMAQLASEILSGEPTENSFTTPDIEWGIERETQARGVYTLRTGNSVVETGFVLHPLLENTGASPDGLVGDDGLLETKCPKTHTHITTLRGGKIDRKYMLQMQWQMECTGRVWCDFVSFDPRLPSPLNMHIQRVHRDDILLCEIKEAIHQFQSELGEMVADLQSRMGNAA